MVLVLTHDDFVDHHPTTLSGTAEVHQEGGDRISAILNVIRELESKGQVELDKDIPLASNEQIARVHDKVYINKVEEATKELEEETSKLQLVGRFSPIVVDLVEDNTFLKKYKEESLADYSATRFSRTTLSCARRAAGAVIKAVDIAAGRTGRVDNRSFALVRPPGHHATPRGFDKTAGGCGFCVFNNVCIGAAHMLTLNEDAKIAIVDFDVHHGNGSQEIVKKRFGGKQVIFISLHLQEIFADNPDMDFFPGTGRKEENNDSIFNIPIQPLWKKTAKRSKGKNKRQRVEAEDGFVGRKGFRRAVSEYVCPRIRDFKPTLLMFSAGFDGYNFDEGSTQDGAAGLDLNADDFGWTTREIIKSCPSTPIVSVLEGGYGSWKASIGAYDRSSLANACRQHIINLIDK